MFQFFTSSRTLSEPIHLYEFSYGIDAVATLRFTDAEDNLVMSGNTFRAVQIKHGEIAISGTLDKAQVEISTPRNNQLVELFRVYPPDGTVNVTIYRGERNDPDAEFKVIWGGRVLNFALAVNEATFTAEPVSTSVRRPGLRRTYQYGCPHALYGDKCKASKAAASKAAAVTAVSGMNVSVAAGWSLAVDPSKYIKGMLEWTTPAGMLVRRTILQVSTGTGGSATLLLNGIPNGLAAGSSVTTILGCNHGMTDCKDLHNNMGNFGGHPWIAIDNPVGQKNNFY